MFRPRSVPIASALRRVIASGDRSRLEKALAILHPADLAQIVPELAADQRKNVIEVLLKLRKAGATLSELPEGCLHDILEELDDAVVLEVVKRLPPDDAVDLIQDLPEERSLRILNGLNIGAARELRELLVYSPETAGGIMTTKFFALREADTAGHAVAALRGSRQESGLYYLYVLDEEGRLRGILSLHQLLLAEEDTRVSELMNERVTTIHPRASQEEAARLIARYNLLALPVVDDAGYMLGVITVDDVVDVIQEEATEDIYRMAGISEGDNVFTGWNESVRLRLPWLTLNLATAVLASRVVALFEPALEAVAALAVFMPIVAGMGGNAATQTITIVVRAIALGQLDSGVRRTVAKEVLVGLVNGVFVGIAGGIIAWLLTDKIIFGVVLCLAMIVNTLVAALAGTLIPFTLRALRLDPAIASSIFVTTLTDIFGFFAFLGLATVFLQYLTG